MDLPQLSENWKHGSPGVRRKEVQCWPGVHQICLADPTGNLSGPPSSRPQGLLQAFYFAFYLVTCMVLQRNNEQETYLTNHL